MKKKLIILFFSLFSIMTGFGLTLPILPFYIERLALSGGSNSIHFSIQVGLITGVFALMLFFFAPIWGRLSDRIGRRPLIILGLGGYTISTAFFGVGTNLEMLYAGRILGGIFAAAILPAANAYVIDLTSEKDRGRGLASMESAISFGIVLGPALGSLLSGNEIHLAYQFWHFRVDGYTLPFFTATIISLCTLGAAVCWLPESRTTRFKDNARSREPDIFQVMTQTPSKLIPTAIRRFLVLALLGKFALALFEGTFALHAQRVIQYGPFEMGAVFVVCGLVMAVGQGTVVGWLIDRVGEKPLLSAGYLLMGLGLVFLMTTSTMGFILFYVSLFASGVALITPSLATLVSRRAGDRPGSAFGFLNAANSLGQAGGPTIGGLLFAWQIHVPYMMTAVILLVAAIFVTKSSLAESARVNLLNGTR